VPGRQIERLRDQPGSTDVHDEQQMAAVRRTAGQQPCRFGRRHASVPASIGMRWSADVSKVLEVTAWTGEAASWTGKAWNSGTWRPTPGVADTDPRHRSFVSGTLGRKPACPACRRAMEFGLGGNWTCRACREAGTAKDAMPDPVPELTTCHGGGTCGLGGLSLRGREQKHESTDGQHSASRPDFGSGDSDRRRPRGVTASASAPPRCDPPHGDEGLHRTRNPFGRTGLRHRARSVGATQAGAPDRSRGRAVSARRASASGTRIVL